MPMESPVGRAQRALSVRVFLCKLGAHADDVGIWRRAARNKVHDERVRALLESALPWIESH